MAPMVLMAFRTERMWMWITDHQIALGNLIFLTDINIAFTFSLIVLHAKKKLKRY